VKLHQLWNRQQKQDYVGNQLDCKGDIIENVEVSANARNRCWVEIFVYWQTLEYKNEHLLYEFAYHKPYEQVVYPPDVGY
jgi:hypothetical protein